MWSLGCIFHDLLTRTVLFAHNNHAEVLYHIYSILGFPQKEEFPAFYELYKFQAVLKSKEFKKLQENKVKPNFNDLFLHIDPVARDLL